MKTAACIIVRDEEDAIAEWILYYHLLGFDTILVFDHKSTDGTFAVALRTRRLVDVRVFRFDRLESGFQGMFYAALCRQCTPEFDWIAFFDIDEFLTGTGGPTCRELLEARADAAAVAVPWLMFGSSGHVEKPAGLMIEDYRRRAPYGFPPNRLVKSIVRPSQVKTCLNAHCFEVDGTTVLPGGDAVDWESPGRLRLYPEHEIWRLHHYFTRSRSHWTQRLKRGQLGPFSRTIEDFDSYDRNEIVDESACRHAPALRGLLGRLAGAEGGLSSIGRLPKA